MKRQGVCTISSSVPALVSWTKLAKLFERKEFRSHVREGVQAVDSKECSVATKKGVNQVLNLRTRGIYAVLAPVEKNSDQYSAH